MKVEGWGIGIGDLGRVRGFGLRDWCEKGLGVGGGFSAEILTNFATGKRVGSLSPGLQGGIQAGVTLVVGVPEARKFMMPWRLKLSAPPITFP